MTHAHKTEVLISGGGFVGLALALALARAGIESAIVEAGDMQAGLAPAFDGRVSSIAPDVRRMLEALDVWSAVEDVQPVSDIVVSGGAPGGRASPFFLHFDREDAGGPLFHIVENRHLRRALAQAVARRPEIALIAPDTIAEARTDSRGAWARLASGGEIAARLIVAAEGRHSPLRDRFGLKVSGWPYGQHGLVCTVAHERPHEGAAQEYFLPSGPFAILPMTGDRSSLVWSEKDDIARALMEASEADFAAEMRRRFTDYLGEVSPVGPRWSYPLSTHLARDYIAARFALAGDAAHGVHPIAGQGLNLGLRDAAVLAEAVVDADRIGLDIGSTAPLEAYQRRRRPDAAMMAGLNDALNRLFSNDIAPVRAAREAGLGLADAIAPVRRLLAKGASGAGFGEPARLLRGEPL